MSGTAYHKNLAPSDIHICYAFLYADENARQLSDGFSSSDVGKLARVVDPDNLLYILVNHSPPTWQKVGGVFDSATSSNLGGVRVQSSGGLFIDAVGNISIKTDFLHKLQNLPDNILDELRSVIDPCGSSKIGFVGYNTTNLTIPADTLDNVLERVINKISQLASDVTTLKTSSVPQATESILGGIKVISGATSGLQLDGPTGYLSIYPDFLTKLNGLNNLLDGKVSSSQLSASGGTSMIGYPGTGSSTDAFYLPPSNLQTAINAIVTQTKINTDAARTGITPATASNLGGIKVGSGLSITSDGTLSSSGGSGGSSYTLPTASSMTLGGVKVNGNGMSISGDGTLICTVTGTGGGTSYTLPTATSSNLGGIKVGSGLVIAGDGTLSATATGGGDTGGTTGTSNIKVYKIDIPDFTQATSTWTVTPNDSGISNIVKTGDDSFQVTYSAASPPVTWSAVNRAPTPSPEVIHSVDRFMRCNSSTKTAEIVSVATSSNILVYLQFIADTGNITSTGGIFTVEGTSGTVGTYTSPAGWTVTYTAPSLRIQHNKNATPYGWSGLNNSTTWNEILHDLSGCYMKVQDANTVLIMNISTITNAFKINLMFV